MIVGLILGIVCVTPIVCAYALFIKWCDRFEPEPWWLLVSAFLFGAVFATFGGGVSSELVQRATAALLGLNGSGETMEAFGATVLAPVFEEGWKGIGVAGIAFLSWAGLKELDGPLDGAIYGGIIGLGFTLTEDILYVAGFYAKAGLPGFFGLLVVRTVLLGLSHCTFTAMTGIGFGMAAETNNVAVKVAAPATGFAVAIVLHAMHNALPTFLGPAGAVAMIFISWASDVFFFVVVAALVVRDRAIVVRELASEVGSLVHPQELALITTYVTIGFRNWVVLLTRGWGPFQLRRRKQLALIELAFLKNRRRRGEYGHTLDAREAGLRQAVARANERGVWLGH